MGWIDEHIDSVICGDSIEVMGTMPPKSVNLIIADPPYNIGKAEWDRIPNYLEWCGEWIAEAERVLMDNGSFYVFHNDVEPMAHIIVRIGQETQFILKNQIIWNKYFDGAFNNGYLKGKTKNENLRHFKQMAEYILFYTFQDETGLSRILPKCFEPYTEYMTQQKNLLGWSIRKFNDFLAYKSIASHWFWQNNIRGLQPQPRFISPIDYAKLQATGYFQRPYEDLRREYEDLRREYEDLRREYEDLRYTFNNQKMHHSVWNYETVKNPVHPTQKPVALIENIIKHSSNEGDIVLSPFLGSGTDAEACVNTNRHYIGIDINEGYCEMAEKRVRQARIEKTLSNKQLDLFQEAADN